MQIVLTSGKQFRLYSEDGTVLGTFNKLMEAKKRKTEREVWLKTQKGVKVK